MSRLRVLTSGTWLVLCVCLGCSSGPELHEVTGTVKYEDGSVPQGEMATINFTPVNPMEGKAAFSNIEPDGSFRLSTFTQGDGGAFAGDYRVTVSVINGYPRGVSVVHPQYTDFSQTPLEATVKPGETNHFDFAVKKP